MGRSLLLMETEIYNNWKKFVHTGEYDPKTIRSVIGHSWEISRRAGIDPYMPLRRYRLPEEEFRVRYERASQIAEVSRPFMESIYKIVAKSGFIVRLTDHEGYIMATLGEPDTLKKMEGLNIQPRDCCREDIVGTNAIGISLRTGTPVQVFAAEHYNRNYHSWTTSSCPIKDKNGEVMAALSLTGSYRNVHSHTLGMVIAAAEAIEKQLQLKESNNRLSLANKHFLAIMESISEGLICIDNNLTVTDINWYAKKILNLPESRIVGRSLNKLFRGYSQKIKNVIEKGEGFSDEEVILDIPGGTLRCVVSTTPIKQSEGVTQGAIITVREGKSIHSLVNRIVGAEARFSLDDIIGICPQIQEAKSRVLLAARNTSNVLLTGESGTGKELFAQAIHNASSRKNGPFIIINCGAIPRELVASELFGYVEGAFTGARRGGHPGKFELADGGTIFLDEIGDMPLDIQANLLRVLETKEIVRVGGSKVIPVDVRVVAATHKNLEKEVETGNFRQDLYYRLNVIRINIPPLRERKEDIKVFIDKFVDKYSVQMGKAVKRIEDAYYRMLENYPWPGNVREMQNVIHQSIIAMEGEELTCKNLPGSIKETMPAVEIGEEERIYTLEELEADGIRKALEMCKGNISRTSRVLGIGRNTLYRKMEKYGIEYAP